MKHDQYKCNIHYSMTLIKDIPTILLNMPDIYILCIHVFQTYFKLLLLKRLGFSVVFQALHKVLRYSDTAVISVRSKFVIDNYTVWTVYSADSI